MTMHEMQDNVEKVQLEANSLMRIVYLAQIEKFSQVSL